MRKLIMPGWFMILVFLCLGVVLLFELVAKDIVDDSTIIGKDVCIVTSLDEKADFVELNMKCGATEFKTTDPDNIVVYLLHKDSLYCEWDKAGNIECKPHKK